MILILLAISRLLFMKNLFVGRPHLSHSSCNSVKLVCCTQYCEFSFDAKMTVLGVSVTAGTWALADSSEYLFIVVVNGTDNCALLSFLRCNCF